MTNISIEYPLYVFKLNLEELNQAEEVSWGASARSLTYLSMTGTVITTKYYTAGETVTINESAPDNTGYGFLGWRSGYSGILMANGSTFVMPDEDIALMAEYDDGAIYNTEIIFEVTVDGAHAGQPLTLIALAGNPLHTYEIAYGDGVEETKNFVAPVAINVPNDNPDRQYSYNDNPLLEHTYAAEGVYTVSIQSGYHISASKFTTLWQDGDEWLLAPVAKPHITKLVKYLSDSIVNINYGFAGLTECIPDPEFKLETPLVTTATAAFHSFGKNASKGDAGAWTFRGDLLSELTELTDLNNMFRACRMREIPQGFFDSQKQVTHLYETFKKSWLGVGYYRQINVTDFMNMNTSGESYIPMNLLHHMLTRPKKTLQIFLLRPA